MINLIQLPISTASHSQLLGVRWRLRTGLAKVRRTPQIAFAGDVSTYMRMLALQVGSSFLNSVPSINFSMSRNLRVLVFDFDGTLVDSNEIKTQDFLETLCRAWGQNTVSCNRIDARKGGLLVETRQWYEELFDLPKRTTGTNFEEI